MSKNEYMLSDKPGGFMPKVLLIILLLSFFPWSRVEADTTSYGPDILKIMDFSSIINFRNGLGKGLRHNSGGLFSNPSEMLGAECLEVSTTHLSWLADYNIESLAAIYPSVWGNFGFGAAYFHQPTDAYIDGNGISTGLTLKKSDLSFAVSFARSFWQIPFGVTARYLHHVLADQTGTSLVFDLGTQFGLEIGSGNLYLGIAIRNLGIGPQFISEKSVIPFLIPIDIGYNFKGTKSDDAGIGFFSSLNFYSSSEFTAEFGTELVFLEHYKIRTGYKYGYESQGLFLGAGIGYNIKNIDFQLDYSAVLNNELGMSHNIQLSAKYWPIGQTAPWISEPKKLDLDEVADFLKGDTSSKIGDDEADMVKNAAEVKCKSAVASSYDGEPNAFLACDGNEGTRWSSEGKKDPQWIAFTLEKSVTVVGIKVRWENAAAKKYEIQVSLNNRDWDKIAEVNDGEQAQERIIKFSTPAKAKYVRIYGKERVNADWGYSIWETKIYQ